MDLLDGNSLRSHWVDLSMLTWMLVSTLIGLMRGLVFEALSLAGWVAAYFGAHWAAPMLAPHLPLGAPGSTLNHAAAFLIAFVGVLFAWGLAARLLRRLLHATPLGLPDRALGAGFGVLRGLVVLLALATVISLTPLAASQAWRRSQGAAWLNVALHGLKPLLSNEISQHLPA